MPAASGSAAVSVDDTSQMVKLASEQDRNCMENYLGQAWRLE
jgi:hypothetical protein